MTCEAGDVVVVPFPFSDRSESKRRPTLVLSDAKFNAAGRTIVAMITTTGSRWPNDTPIADPSPTGLKHPSLIRLKVFTVDNPLILSRAGRLHPSDLSALAANLRTVLLPGVR